MSWWQIFLVAYLILTPFSEILTIAVVMVLVEDWQYRRRKKREKDRPETYKCACRICERERNGT